MSRLYTLVVKLDNIVLVEVDQEKLDEGSMKDDWEAGRQEANRIIQQHEFLRPRLELPN